MKNSHIEKLKHMAKLAHRNDSRSRYEDGIVVRHVYDDLNPKDLTWWDDTGFILNDYKVCIAWNHPRNAYNYATEELAHIEVDHLFERKSSLFSDATPNFKAVGKSRKKVTSWTSSGRSLLNQEWYAAYQQAHARILVDNDIIITPTIDVSWNSWCKSVSICVPMEIRGVADLKDLCALTKAVLTRKTTLAAEFLNYTYTVEDWKAETGQSGAPGLVSHQVV